MPKIAVAQVEVFDELNKNVKKVLDFIDKASFKNADLVCFPESCLGEDFLNIDCKEIRSIQEKCKEKSIYCIFCARIKEKVKIFNSAILVDKSSKIQYVYKKVNLFPNLDLGQTSPGKDNKVIETDFGKIGIVIQKPGSNLFASMIRNCCLSPIRVLVDPMTASLMVKYES